MIIYLSLPTGPIEKCIIKKYRKVDACISHGPKIATYEIMEIFVMGLLIEKVVLLWAANVLNKLVAWANR